MLAINAISFNIDTILCVLLPLSNDFSDLEPLPAERHPSQQKDPEQRLKEPGANDSGSTAPRSTEGSISEDVFTEPELSPIREEEQVSNEDLRLDKSSATSTESVLTVTQVEATSAGSNAPGSACGTLSQAEEPTPVKPEDNPPDTATENDSQSPMGSKQHSVEKPPSTPTTTSSSTSQGQGPSSSTSRPGSQSSANPLGEADEGTDVPKTDTMQQGKEEKENVEQMPKDGTQNSAEGKHTYLLVVMCSLNLVENISGDESDLMLSFSCNPTSIFL